MARIKLQNEAADPAAASADTLYIYPVGDALRTQNSAGEVKTVLTADTTYAYLFGDVDTDGSLRISTSTADNSATLEIRSTTWQELVKWALA